jgi:hypothetical protein
MRKHCDVKVLDYEQPMPGVKLSVDTWDDLQFVRKIVATLGPDCTLEEIYGWLSSR